ncbi:aquaporin-like [Ptychodera flava]|uniref:aquaporin-like n=1 Tax=Ptychodera flava TaxID=63121 RepID=UPI00396A47EB
MLVKHSESKMAERKTRQGSSHSRRKHRKRCRIPVSFWRSVIAECLCTFFFMIIVCASHLEWNGARMSVVEISLTLGLAVITLIQCFEHISGAHMNPAVSAGMLFARKIGIVRAIFYIAAQCLGAITGTAVMTGFAPKGIRGNLGMSYLSELVSPLGGFGVEFLITFILAFTVLASTDPNRKILGTSALPVGAAYAMNTLWAYNFTGASMNPARTLGPFLVLNTWEDHWIYWAGPFAGGCIAAVVYVYIFDPSIEVGSPSSSKSRDRHRENSETSGSLESSSNLYTSEPSITLDIPLASKQYEVSV